MLKGYCKSVILCIVVYAIILITCGNTNHTLKAHNVKDGKTTGKKEAHKVAMDEVECWCYNIQDIETDRQYDHLVGSHFDMYVIETLPEIKKHMPVFCVEYTQDKDG